MKKYTLFSILLFCTISLAVRAQNAPVTTAPYIADAVPGNVDVNITVEDFTDIGALTLTFIYDPVVLGFLGYTPNAAFNAPSFSVTSSVVSSGIYKITISYPDGNPLVTLADGSTLVSISFSYTYEGGINYSALTWSDDGSSCQYWDAEDTPLIDSPTADYYHNGLVASQVAPESFLPVNYFYIGGTFQVPVTVNNFTDIGSISLTFEYDSDVITYDGTFSSGFSGMDISDNTGSGSYREIVIGWFGDPASLPDGSTIVSLDFTYNIGTTTLHWIDDGISCDYADWQYYSLYDSPTSDFYSDGIIAQKMAPLIKADTVLAEEDEIAIIPLSVWDFTDINSFTLTLDFDPLVLTFLCATPHPDLNDGFGFSEVDDGRIGLSWSGSSMLTFTDATSVIYLAFSYIGGTSAITWYNNGSSCVYTTGALFTPLNDLPTPQYFHNGQVKPAPGPAVWTGGTSTDWNVASNWQDNKVPDSFFDVTITDSPVPPGNWPVYTGDFTVGGQCKNINLTGAAQMTVTGDMNIQPGLQINILDNGLIKVGGDWINNGLFDPGTGIVDFYGNTQGEIPVDVFPGKALSNYSLATVTAGMTNLTGASAGPAGDDAHSDVGIGFSFNYLGVAYTTARINTNGWISLDGSGDDANSGNNSLLFFAEIPTTVIAPWWDDLNADGSAQISYKTEGSPPDRVFTAEWKNMLSYSSGATARLNFQVKLHETTGLIEFCYGTVTAGDHNPGEGASIGMKDATGGTGHYIEATTGSTSCVMTCIVSNASWPAFNYEFSPPETSDEEIFWGISISKEENVKLLIKRDTRVLGLTP